MALALAVRTRRRAWGAIFALGIAATHSSAWAGPPSTDPNAVAAADKEKRAAAAFFEGQAAFEKGDYRRAGQAFESAYALKRHYASLWNAAQSWQRAGEDLRAANLLDQYLREAPVDAPDREAATAALVDVGHRVGRLQVQLASAEGAKIDGTPMDHATTYVAVGEHIVTAIAQGTPIRRQVSVHAGEIVSVTLSPPEPRPVTLAVREEPRSSTRSWPPWTLAFAGGIVVAGGVLTAISGFDTVDKKHAFLADETQPRLDDAYASQTRTNVLLAATVGVSLVACAIAAFVVDWNRDSRVSGKSHGAR